MNRNRLTLIAAQDEYVDTVVAGMTRWSHRKDGGHIVRIRRGARKALQSKLTRMGFTPSQIPQIVQDARDMAELVYLSEVI